MGAPAGVGTFTVADRCVDGGKGAMGQDPVSEATDEVAAGEATDKDGSISSDLPVCSVGELKLA